MIFYLTKCEHRIITSDKQFPLLKTKKIYNEKCKEVVIIYNHKSYSWA